MPTAFADLQIPLVNNWQAKEIRTGDTAREGLFQQIPNTVRWTESVQYLASNGVDRWFEVGCGLGSLRPAPNDSPGCEVHRIR